MPLRTKVLLGHFRAQMYSQQSLMCRCKCHSKEKTAKVSWSMSCFDGNDKSLIEKYSIISFIVTKKRTINQLGKIYKDRVSYVQIFEYSFNHRVCQLTLLLTQMQMINNNHLECVIARTTKIIRKINPLKRSTQDRTTIFNLRIASHS